MTNYHACFRGHAFRGGPSKEELRLRATKQNKDPKKIEEALNTLHGAKDVGTIVPHSKGEEIFGSRKRKLDVYICNARDSHRSGKVNFSQPHVQTRSTTASLVFFEGPSKQPEANTIFLTYYNNI